MKLAGGAAIIAAGLMLSGCASASAAKPSPTPTPTPVSIETRQANCTAYWLDQRPVHEDWTESIADQYRDGIDRKCEGVVSEDDDAFARG
ncbi:hypothetical protein EDF63_1609 [Curtobacterium sp. JUb34]|nr:hypothetical protein EDF63_1609 [Curtobacterium sp. JUb34]